MKSDLNTFAENVDLMLSTVFTSFQEIESWKDLQRAIIKVKFSNVLEQWEQVDQ